MDKLKIFLEVLKKYHFWATCVVMLLVAIICWWVATAGLASQFQKRKTKLEGDFSGVQRIRQNDPNDKVIEAIRDQETVLKEQVWKAWEILYNEQKEKNPFPTVLGEDFKRQFENLKPKGELPRKYRENYQNYIMRYLPILLDEVEILRPVEEEVPAPGVGRDAAAGARPARRMLGRGLGGRNPGAGMRGMGGAAETEQEWTGIVDWDSSNIQQLENRFIWDNTPSTLAVVLAQEDLWVIGALLRVIARTNEVATGPASAAVKQIEAIEIGREAIGNSSAAATPIFQPGAAASGQMGGGMMGGGMRGGGMPGGGMDGGGMRGMGGGMRGGGMMGGGMRGGGMGGTAGTTSDAQVLLEGRYVDDKGMPLPATSEYPYAQHPYAEFKMMPIRMDLVMDQRRLPKLLVECANSNMPIEIRRVRVLKGKDGAVRSGARSARGGRGMMGPMGGRGQGGAVRTLGAPTDAGVNDIPVEIYGVIYIYNPPDREKLGTGAASQEEPVDAATVGEPETSGAETPMETPMPAGVQNP